MSGKAIEKGKECSKCLGKRIIMDDVKLEVPIPPGTVEGDKICLRGQAHDNPDCSETGDLYLIINQKASKTGLRREGDDLIYEKEIDLVGALCGVEFYIKHLDDRYIKAKFTGIIHSGQVMKIDNEGMPRQKNDMGFGDMYVKFIINFPNKLSDKRKELLRKILPGSENIFDVKPGKDDNIDEKEMVASDNKYQSHFNNMRSEMTEDMMSEDENEQATECVQQ